jgi:hypothetical protein
LAIRTRRNSNTEYLGAVGISQGEVAESIPNGDITDWSNSLQQGLVGCARRERQARTDMTHQPIRKPGASTATIRERSFSL